MADIRLFGAPRARYRCKCGWIGTEDEMNADSFMTGDGEAWSNWICPRCDVWASGVDEYEELAEGANG